MQGGRPGLSMDNIRNVFELNRPIIQFAYGLSFFVMGLAIALQSRSSSRLELARSLAWLAAFGITHGLYQWGELFSPVQEAYLQPSGIALLHSLHLVFLSISFACLLEFGVALLQPLGRYQWMEWITWAVLLGSWVVMFYILYRTIPSPKGWHQTSEALARYLLGFPGALLSAYGLREQTFRRIAPLNPPSIVNTLRGAGIALALYAIFGGLIPPPVSFFPGNVINEATFEQALGVPPLVFQSVIGVWLAFTIIRALEVFDYEVERRIETVEQQQILSAERERIARDLHDGTIQTIYTAGLLVDSARKLVPTESAVASRLDKVVIVLDDAIHDLRRSLGELHQTPSGEPLGEALQKLAGDPRFRSLVQVSLDIDLPRDESLAPARSDHVLSVVREALSNVIRHAYARHVRISAHQSEGCLQISVQDDGVGLPGEPQEGYGLRNMMDRARLLGGELEITGSRGKGTTVNLKVPFKDTR